jgi:hypothetical protein
MLHLLEKLHAVLLQALSPYRLTRIILSELNRPRGKQKHITTIWSLGSRKLLLLKFGEWRKSLRQP